jgi:hypothetical protein
MIPLLLINVVFVLHAVSATPAGRMDPLDDDRVGDFDVSFDVVACDAGFFRDDVSDVTTAPSTVCYRDSCVPLSDVVPFPQVSPLDGVLRAAPRLGLRVSVWNPLTSSQAAKVRTLYPGEDDSNTLNLGLFMGSPV